MHLIVSSPACGLAGRVVERRRPRFWRKPGGVAVFHTTDRGSTAVNRDHVLRRAGLRVPDPLFATTIPAGRRSSCPAPLSPGGQPDPNPSTGESDVRPLRWARCPDEGRLHLLAPAEVLRATGRGHARALCGRSVPARGLTITDDSSGALCMACVVGVPAGSKDLDPKGTAPSSLAGHRCSIDPPGSRWPAGHPPTSEVTPAMPTPPPRPAADPWRDAEGTPIPLQSRVEQVVVDKEHGALPSRLHQQGQVTGRGTNLVYVLFDHGNQLIALRPHLVRVLDTPDSC